MEYSVHLISKYGKSDILTERGKTTWKTKHVAIKHAERIQDYIDSGLKISDSVVVKNNLGEVVWVKDYISKNT